MKRKLPPLNSLRSFEAVGRHGSISAAAGELGVTEPAVSRALKNLENHFGVNLFYRHTNGLLLSEHGMLILPEITSALDQVARAAGQIYDRQRYSLALLATPTIASRWIAPIIGDFMAAHPDISVNLHSSFRPQEILNYGFDLAIWNIECDRPECDREPIFSVNRCPISSVDMARDLFADGDVGALQDASLVHEYDYSEWMEWFQKNGLDPEAAANGFVSDNFSAVLQATINGAGVSLLFQTYLSDPLFGHLLTAPFGDDQVIETQYWLYTRNTNYDDKPLRRMQEFLCHRLKGG